MDSYWTCFWNSGESITTSEGKKSEDHERNKATPDRMTLFFNSRPFLIADRFLILVENHHFFPCHGSLIGADLKNIQTAGEFPYADCCGIVSCPDFAIEDDAANLVDKSDRRIFFDGTR